MRKRCRKLIDLYYKMPIEIKAGIWFTVCNILQRGIQFLTTPIFTRILSVDEFGLYSIYFSWMNLISIFATMNLSGGAYYNGLLKFESNRLEYTSSLQFLGSISTIVIFGIIGLIYQVIYPYIGLPISTIMMMFVSVFFNPSLQFWTVQQRYNYKYRKLILVTFLNSIIAPLIGILLIYYYDLGYLGLIVGYTITSVIVGGGFYFSNIIKGKAFVNKQFWEYSLRLSVPLIPHYLSSIILGQSDRIMINYYCGTAEAGIYSLAYQVSLIMNLFISGVNNSLTPWIYRTMKKEAFDVIKKNTTLLFLVICVLTALMMLVTPEIIYILGTEDYYEAISIIPLVMFASFVTFVYCTFGTILFFYEKTKRVSIATSIGAVINVIFNMIFIPNYGFKAAAYTTIGGYVVITLLYGFFVDIECRVNKYSIFTIFGIKEIGFMMMGLFMASLFVTKVIVLSAYIRYFILCVALVIVIVNRNAIKNILLKIKEKS